MPRAKKTFTLEAPKQELDWANPTVLRGAAQLLARQRSAMARYEDDPWIFLTECVQTLDQVSGKIRPFPNHPYLQTLTGLWQQEKLLLVAKSRRMVVTWLFVALYYWLVRFRPNTKVAFLARKEGRSEAEGSAELVWRAKFIHEHLPAFLPPVTVDYKFCRFTIPAQHSEIVGMGEGTEQLRQHTLTGIFADELAFWMQAYETYVASRPTIEGGGRFTGVSSAAPGFFAQLVQDQV